MKIKRISDATARNFKARICHISDTHSGLPPLYGRYDFVLHTGDFSPNSHHVSTGNKVREAEFQLQWVKDHAAEMRQWLQGHPFLFILGNHDFMSPEMFEELLRSENINAINLTDKVTTFMGITFYGFPYVPAINGMWNYEREIPEMEVEVDRMVAELNKTHVDVLACHAPLHQSLDLSMGNQILGSSVITNALDYKLDKAMMPSYYLCGHIHEAHGMSVRNGMVISNAATTKHIIEVA